ncbi:10546_t:CDS:2 [Paraglomus occultum]|uniref:10546_t:CDS:1 n=1 Tax=Paraglomus occultum TaxID=144539 RepID=A0A9N9FX36_9GLOM|nr:10546_t:CDS:2 [Paraglomus occultum]
MTAFSSPQQQFQVTARNLITDDTAGSNPSTSTPITSAATANSISNITPTLVTPLSTSTRLLHRPRPEASSSTSTPPTIPPRYHSTAETVTSNTLWKQNTASMSSGISSIHSPHNYSHNNRKTHSLDSTNIHIPSQRPSLPCSLPYTPHYHSYSTEHFDRTYSVQVTRRKRELLLRKLLSASFIACLTAILAYFYFSSSNTSRQLYNSKHGYGNSIRTNNIDNIKNNDQTDQRYFAHNQADTHKDIFSSDSSRTSHPTTHANDIILYRILGNDLPPRHKTGQTLQNLKFILDNEEPFPRTTKYWILNRIFDQSYEKALINLLEARNQSYLRIPFEVDEYLKHDFRLEDFPESDFFHSEEFSRFTNVGKLRTMDHTYYDKNLYVMNNNGGRNAAIQHGKLLPNIRWIFPLDGNCFLTANAHADIIRQLDSYGNDYKYFIIPMARLVNNTQLLVNKDERPSTPEEPQIVFRHDAEMAYNSGMRYGRRSKLELLWRLGVPPRSTHHKQPVPWEVSHPAPSPPSSPLYKSAGWVFRLFSGHSAQELPQKEASTLRALNRLLAIQGFIDNVDETIARTVQGFNPHKLWIYDEEEFEKVKLNLWVGDQKTKKLVSFLADRANMIAKDIEKDVVVVEKNVWALGNGLRKWNDRNADRDDAKFNIMSEKYNQEHLNRENKDKGQFVDNIITYTNCQERSQERELGGEVNNGHYLATPDAHTQAGSKSHHCTPSLSTNNMHLAPLFENITTLTLSHYFSSNDVHARHAANLIRWVLLSSYAVGDQNDPDVVHSTTESETDQYPDEGYAFPALHRIPRVMEKYAKLDYNMRYENEYEDPRKENQNGKFSKEEDEIVKELLRTDLSHFLDSCRLLYRSHALSHHEYLELKSLASTWLELLLYSSSAIATSRLPDHRATLYDLNVSALAAFTNDVRMYLRVINRCRMRIGKHFHVSPYAGQTKQIFEIDYVNTYGSEKNDLNEYNEALLKHSTLNLQYWLLLTRGVQNAAVGKDLWQYTAKQGQRLPRAMMSHLDLYHSRVQVQDDILKPLLHIAQAAHSNIGGKMDVFGDLEGKKEWRRIVERRVGIGSEAREWGIPPFWMLGIA